MRFSLPSEKRFTGPRYEEIDKRENAELIREIKLHFVPRAGGGGRGGGGGGGRGGSGGGGGGGSGGGSRGGVTFSGASGNRGASSYGQGGGPVTTISSGAFSGRSIGSGTRQQVYGNSRYGSGYTYGGGSSVAAEGAGGNTTINNATASYYLVGDADTVSAVMEAVVAQCSVANATGTPVDDNNSTVHVEQAVQYYRSSSFMLALTSYNNSASLPSNAPTDNNTAPLPPSADTPLPTGTNTTFLNCLNETIGASIPIMDAAPGALRATSGLNAVGILWLMIWLMKMF
ncbi:unnamed protein product [Rhizoctonia solani]|uniref:Uncharacterized protein n=1 Tax=Rhizoctonia solani TaxID=456999 RepID=A0A8H3CSR5_9AGAM|nr:unnamed protein product [Rhizoctonia solani]